ncbi:GNAT family N-acetyltransferase [Aquimarina sp. 2201CG1-2-11]|uniref:GNAT family N-acetyltransferase n=1 Tax=Aquimarina discodermiae TaxID=3231043 RepID=UPI003463149A
MKKIHIDYFFELYEKKSIPNIFSKLSASKNQEQILNPDYDKKIVDKKDSVYSVFFIPDYFKPEIDHKVLAVKKVKQFFKGYTIFLDGFVDADAYVKHRFRSNAKAIRRRVKRLETCFDISYKTYYGAIEEEEYHELMDRLEEMLVKRFEERNDVSQSLLRWDYYKDMYFSLINKKQASLFVVYHKKTPIVVSLNHHFKERLFSAISSYDIDFRKFSLGNVEILKKLDWCIQNGHKSYEMGMGDLSYKREWCNHVYNFEHQIIYPKNSFLGVLKAMIEYIKVSFKEFVYKKTYVKYKKYKTRKKQAISNDEMFCQVSKIEDLNYNDKHTVIDYNHSDYDFLRKIVFDFVYTSIEHISNVSVVEISKTEKSFLILGSSKMQKVIVS